MNELGNEFWLLGPGLLLVLLVEHLGAKNAPNLARYVLGGLAVGGAQWALGVPVLWVVLPWGMAGLWVALIYAVEGVWDRRKAGRARRRAARVAVDRLAAPRGALPGAVGWAEIRRAGHVVPVRKGDDDAGDTRLSHHPNGNAAGGTGKGAG